MSSILKVSALALALAAAPTAAALAQSYTAPAGIPAATAPGAAAGRTVERNLFRVVPGADDAIVTGSVGRVRTHRGDRR